MRMRHAMPLCLTLGYMPRPPVSVGLGPVSGVGLGPCPSPVIVGGRRVSWYGIEIEMIVV